MVGQTKKERRRNRKTINTRDLLTRQLGTLKEIRQLSPQPTGGHITNPH